MVSIKKILGRALITIPLIFAPIASSGLEQKINESILKYNFTPPSPDYCNVKHTDISWKEVKQGLEFSKVEVYNDNKLVDIIAVLKINPKYNELKVFTAFNNYDSDSLKTIEEWQEISGAVALFNSAQYKAQPWGGSCGLNIRRGKTFGPKKNDKVKGMLVSGPIKEGLPEMDLLDFKYDKFDANNVLYKEGVQHWPILLDRTSSIRVKKTDWQANRTVVAKDWNKNILVFTTEGGFFTLYNFGKFLKESNQRKDKGFNVHTAMNMDGGYEAEMMIKSDKINYLTYGKYETYGVNNNVSVLDARMDLPTILGIFSK